MRSPETDLETNDQVWGPWLPTQYASGECVILSQDFWKDADPAKCDGPDALSTSSPEGKSLTGPYSNSLLSPAGSPSLAPRTLVAQGGPSLVKGAHGPF